MRNHKRVAAAVAKNKNRNTIGMRSSKWARKVVNKGQADRSRADSNMTRRTPFKPKL